MSTDFDVLRELGAMVIDAMIEREERRKRKNKQIHKIFVKGLLKQLGAK